MTSYALLNEEGGEGIERRSNYGKKKQLVYFIQTPHRIVHTHQYCARVWWFGPKGVVQAQTQVEGVRQAVLPRLLSHPAMGVQATA